MSSFYCYSRAESSFTPSAHSPSCFQGEMSKRYRLSRNPLASRRLHGARQPFSRGPASAAKLLAGLDMRSLTIPKLLSAVHPLFFHASVLLCVLFLLLQMLFLTSAHSCCLPAFISQQISMLHLPCAGFVPDMDQAEKSLLSV